MTNNNKKSGNAFERELAETLYKQGFWVHLLSANASGQPADIITVHNKKAYLIDCKVCSGKGFRLDRMEENQNLSMSFWKECGNGEGWFAVKVDEIIYMIPHFILTALHRSRSYISRNEIISYGIEFGKWVSECK